MNESILYQTDLIEVGVFSVNPHEPSFLETGFVSSPIIVFPKNSIWIQHDGSTPFVADPTLVNFYNQGQTYRRFAINQAGDYCHWFRISDDLLSQVVAKERRHFKLENMHCPASVFLQHLQVLKMISQIESGHETHFDLWIEEQVLSLFQALLSQPGINDSTLKPKPQKHRLLVERVKESIQADLSVNLSLQQLSDLHHTSPFHLSRVFKAVNGQGINQYRTQQRLRSLVLEIQQHEVDFVDLAFDYGFSSHSHMSSSFKQLFGFTPSECQDQIMLQ
ncbi:MAG: helix-turn-helix transcriptional regulator [Marinicella sp.]